jgi:hypothetical protein
MVVWASAIGVSGIITCTAGANATNPVLCLYRLAFLYFFHAHQRLQEKAELHGPQFHEVHHPGEIFRSERFLIGTDAQIIKISESPLQRRSQRIGSAAVSPEGKMLVTIDGRMLTYPEIDKLLADHLHCRPPINSEPHARVFHPSPLDHSVSLHSERRRVPDRRSFQEGFLSGLRRGVVFARGTSSARVTEVRVALWRYVPASPKRLTRNRRTMEECLRDGS